MSVRRYPIIIEQTGTGYSAYSPDVSGCVAIGDTEQETRRNFQRPWLRTLRPCAKLASPFPNHTLESVTSKSRSHGVRESRGAADGVGDLTAIMQDLTWSQSAFLNTGQATSQTHP
jgi:hypothetical protein